MTTSPDLPSGAAVGAVERAARSPTASPAVSTSSRRTVERLLLARLQQPLDRLLAVDGRRDPAGALRRQRDGQLIAGEAAAAAGAARRGRASRRRGATAAGVAGSGRRRGRRSGRGAVGAARDPARARRPPAAPASGAAGRPSVAKYSRPPAIGTLISDQPEKRAGRPPLALDRLVVLDLIRRRMAGGHRVVRKLRDEVLNRRFGIEADLDRVRADERAAEDAAGQAARCRCARAPRARRPKSSWRSRSGAARRRGARARREACRRNRWTSVLEA